MAMAVLVPNALTDTNSNVASGAYTDIDSTVDDADANLLVSVANAWTGSGTGTAFSFALTDLPAAADTVVSVELRVRARFDNSSDDIITVICDITGTNAPTDSITWTVSTAALSNKSTNAISTSATPANINGWSARVYQSSFFQEGAADGVTFSIDEIELIVQYNPAASSGEPTDFSELNAEKITRNPQITRMPKTQTEWNRFVYGLGQLIRNETSGFEPVLTGFSTDPTSSFCWYHRYGQIVYMEFAFGLGTSNAASFKITNLPASITPSAQQRCLVNGIMQDNSSDLSLGSSALVAATGTITFFPLANTNGSWTTSNNKGFNMPSGQFANIMYFLRNPDKH